jgi:hypothetical protein
MGGKSAQTHALADHIDASNLWSFFQAKTIRQTTMRTAADAIEAQYKDGRRQCRLGEEAGRDLAQDRPALRNGARRPTRAARNSPPGAKARRRRASKSMSAYHMFEYGSAALQLAIVLAGAAALTSVVWLMFLSCGLGRSGFFRRAGLLRADPRPSVARLRPLAPAAGTGRHEVRHLGLIVVRRILVYAADGRRSAGMRHRPEPGARCHPAPRRGRLGGCG